MLSETSNRLVDNAIKLIYSAEIFITSDDIFNQVYLYVRENQIVGFLVVDEDIKKAHRMIPTGDDSVNCCTEDTVPAVCGVYAIWTALKNRKQGIATKLLDVLR